MNDETSPDAAEQANFSAVSVNGDFVDRVAVVSSVNLSTVTTVGSLDDKPVLLCFVDWSMAAGTDTEAEGEARLVSFENIAFVLAKTASEYSRVCDEVSQLSSGGISADENRMKYVASTLDQAIRYLENAKRNLFA